MATVLLGVSGGIAAYKSAQLVSDLKKLGYDIEVLMTKNATEFITPLTFSSLTSHNTYVDMFAKGVNYEVEHISLAKRGDIFVIAPSTANVIAKVASGIADDMLTTTFLAFDGPKVICPAMNTQMYNAAITQANIQRLKDFGIDIIEPDNGLLACGDIGKGKLAPIEDIIDVIEYYCAYPIKALKGKRVLVSAGPTKEALDPVRYITNHSSGKMGLAIALAARNMGADVTLVRGMKGQSYKGIKTIDVTSAKDMYEAIMAHKDSQDYIIMAAAVADYRPKDISTQKLKKTDKNLVLDLESTEDILKTLSRNKTYKLCGFAMESENLIENAKKKYDAKGLDLMVANDISQEGAGFGKDTNIVTFIDKNGIHSLPLMSKRDLAYKILERLEEV